MMSAITKNVQLELENGTSCAALFVADSGVTLFRQGREQGHVTEHEICEYAARSNGASELANLIGAMLVPPTLCIRSKEDLSSAAYFWFQDRFPPPG